MQGGLRDARERWDGKGEPARLKGNDIAPAARFVQVASQAVVFARLGGDAARRIVKLRAGAPRAEPGVEPAAGPPIEEHAGPSI